MFAFQSKRFENAFGGVALGGVRSHEEYKDIEEHKDQKGKSSNLFN
jgi:hypothetical protein